MKTYRIEQGDTLETIARKLGVSSIELKSFHNTHCDLKDLLGGIDLPKHLNEILIDDNWKIKENESIEEFNEEIIEFNQQARYRCEQTVLMKLNGIVHSHADTKTEFLVSKINKNNHLSFKVELIENIVEAYKKELELAIKLVTEIDLIKSSVTVSIDEKGKIKKLLNYSEILKKWEYKKNLLINDFSFIRSSKTEKDFQDFLEVTDQQFSNEDILVNDLYSKIFFDVFFDKYLVSDTFENKYSKKYSSQLFDAYGIMIHFNQHIVSENKTHVQLRKVSSFNKSDLDLDYLKQQYDYKFKPIVKYQFSEYNFSVRERSIINTEDRWLESSDITFIEEVKNNVQVLVDYKIRKIE